MTRPFLVIERRRKNVWFVVGEPDRVDKAKESLSKVVVGIGTFTRSASSQVAEQAGELKDTTLEKVETLTAKKQDPYDIATAEYNGVFVDMNDKGLSLWRQRERSTDLISLVELLINSIANTPKSFETDVAEINAHRAEFVEAEEFARRDLAAARKSAAGAGAGFAAGAAVASIAPSAAMWVATTFGTASTGTAISTLSGAAASQAALAWLGGGALTAGGGGTAAGTSLLALAGPIGWGVAGATLLTSIALFTKKKFENREAKHEALLAVKQNTALVRSMEAEIDDLLSRTASLREALLGQYTNALPCLNANFLDLSEARQAELVTLVNNTKACAALLGRRIDSVVETEESIVSEETEEAPADE